MAPRLTPNLFDPPRPLLNPNDRESSFNTTRYGGKTANKARGISIL